MELYYHNDCGTHQYCSQDYFRISLHRFLLIGLTFNSSIVITWLGDIRSNQLPHKAHDGNNECKASKEGVVGEVSEETDGHATSAWLA
jgi:hypothetical protein